jgi:hypothetical protein
VLLLMGGTGARFTRTQTKTQRGDGQDEGAAKK